VSADQFIAAALEWFGDPDPTKGSPWDKGERLAELVKRGRTLLILDGLEPLQNPPPVETGKIKDPALSTLLRELARQNPGLVVITTRLPVDDLKDFVVHPHPIPPPSTTGEGGTVVQIDLENLSPEAGAAYLAHLGVRGARAELEAAAKEFAGHALALTLLGSYLQVVYRGDVRQRGQIAKLTDERRQGAHARRVLESYEKWFDGKPEPDILRLMGLFDRPAEGGAIEALRAEPAIEGLTTKLQKLSEVDWRWAVENLRTARLLAEADPAEPETLDCHPLLREHFGEKVKGSNPQAWREAHGRLYEYYKTHVKEYPETVEEMAPLYAAVMHGCGAGRHQEALDEVYWRRVKRGNEHFSTKKLGAFGADLAVLSGFFDPPWRQVVAGLKEDAKGFVLSQAGFNLQSLGRLAEAAQPMQAALEATITQKDWRNGAHDASNLSQLYLTIGDIKQALALARQGVELADRSGGAFSRMALRSDLADASHQSEQVSEAEAVFREAEEMQKAWQPEYPLLYSLQGFQYCDLLLSQKRYEEVLRRARQTLEWANQNLRSGGSLLGIALDHLSLGRAYLMQAQDVVGAIRESPLPVPLSPPLRDAGIHLDEAVNGLRKAGQQQELPRGLLARAELRRVIGEFENARADVDEAYAIATRGGMRLHEADCYLEYAQWHLARGKGGHETRLYTSPDTSPHADDDIAKARENLAKAKQMIQEMGYHRRDGEVETLEKAMTKDQEPKIKNQ
jgi:tetratricopeptide (TPR) repeat protein